MVFAIFLPLHPATDLFSSVFCPQFKSDTHSLVISWMPHQQHSTRKSASQHTDTHVSAACCDVIGWLTCAAGAAVELGIQSTSSLPHLAPPPYECIYNGQFTNR